MRCTLTGVGTQIRGISLRDYFFLEAFLGPQVGLSHVDCSWPMCQGMEVEKEGTSQAKRETEAKVQR